MEKTQPGFFYLLEIKANVYKFGITKNIDNRLATHRATLNYSKCINVWNLDNKEEARKLETKLKRYLIANNMIVNYLDNRDNYQTEIFVCDDLEDIMMFIAENMVSIVDDNFTIETLEKKQSNNSEFHCDKCGKKFKSQRDTDRHVNRKRQCIILEPDLTRFSCPKCNRPYIQKCHLTRHMKRCGEVVTREDKEDKIKFNDTIANLRKYLNILEIEYSSEGFDDEIYAIRKIIFDIEVKKSSNE